jgi:aminopeptidase-like protein
MKLDKYDSCHRMMRFIRTVYPLQRMINSEGLDEAFNIVKQEIPEVVIHEYSSGLECGDWIVPKGWKVKEAYLENKQGKRLADFDANPLFVAAYSEPVSGWFHKTEIAKHVRSHPTKPDAYFLEHRNAYNYKLRDWGITLPVNLWDSMPEEDFFVHIEIEWSERSMKVAEIFVPGESDQVISISAHIDEICNDDLSGCAVGLEMIRYIQQLSNRKYSYQLLLVPETIGTFFYVFNNLERVKKTIGMYNLETVGAGENWVLKKALAPGSYIELALTSALKNIDTDFTVIDFFSGYGNDERVYEWPTLKIPGVALQRFPFYEYHSSDDTPDNIDELLLFEAVKVSCELVDVLEKDYIPEYTSIIPPWLTRHDLYYDSKENTTNFHKFNNLLLFNIDGSKRISDLAESAGLKFNEVVDYLSKFLNQGFISAKQIVS